MTFGFFADKPLRLFALRFAPILVQTLDFCRTLTLKTKRPGNRTVDRAGQPFADYFQVPASVGLVRQTDERNSDQSAPGGTMQLSAAGLELVKSSEGFRDRTYLDVAGFPTIGYGHRLVVRESFPNGVSRELAEEMLKADVCRAEQAVQRLVRVTLTQGQFDALTDFCFNLGAGRLASSTLLVALNAGRFEAARVQLLRWDLAAGEVNAGLKARREAEFQLWGAAPAQEQEGA